MKIYKLKNNLLMTIGEIVAIEKLMEYVWNKLNFIWLVARSKI